MKQTESEMRKDCHLLVGFKRASTPFGIEEMEGFYF